ncbi:hypothetical protein HRbin32_00434 [bacterium HR32]|nr:hypothetical protein HRbin32_00434 [bacterium HR32]
MSAPEPLYGVSVWSTPHNDLWDDLDQIQRTGGRAVGLWEAKLPEDDGAVAERLRTLGLVVTSAAPRIWTVFPVAWRSRVSYLDLSHTARDPFARTETMLASLPRLARFAPRCLLVATGDASALDRDHAVDVLRRALGRVAAAAAALGLRVGLELTSVRRGCPFRDLDDVVAFLGGLPQRNVDVVLDVFHNGADPKLREQVRRHVHRICGVHVNDVPLVERVWFDRVLPGQGRGLAVEVVAALVESGFRGWYELEVFSDDGTFGQALPDSLWRIPHEDLLRRAHEAFRETYRRACAVALARAQRS